MELSEFRAELARYPVKYPSDAVLLPTAATSVPAQQAVASSTSDTPSKMRLPSTAEYVAAGGGAEGFSRKLQAWLQAGGAGEEEGEATASRLVQLWGLTSLSLNKQDLVVVARGVHSHTSPGT